MKIFCVLLGAVVAGFFPAVTADAQILMSGGTYSQNFDSLANSGTPSWTNNVTLPGWYASKNSTNVTSYTIGTGTSTSGGLYSFGVAGANALSDRALGSLGSVSASPVIYGVRFTNDTSLTATNIAISYTGEQWRNGGSGNIQTLAFSYGISGAPITNSYAAATWTSFTSLDFNTPIVGATASALDGNATVNRQIFTNVVLSGVTVPPGQEILLRWLDLDDTGSDSALAIDDLIVSFQTTTNGVPPTNAPPAITTQPQSQMVNAGDSVVFSVVASGTMPLSYQWRSNNVVVAGATSSTFTLASVTTNLTGSVYFVTVTNLAGTTNSQSAILTVNAAVPVVPPDNTNGAITLMTYNVKGNGVADWSTNSAQVRAIGRQVQYLQPDIITFNEIPFTNAWQMPNFVAAFLPGYYFATNSGGDYYIRSVIVSRYPIVRSQSWLNRSSLTSFGYSGVFTRDLFEAQISVPGFAAPLHVFTTHLKSSGTNYPDSAAHRAAEAAAITNFLATVFFTSNSAHPYVLSGDMNESDTSQLAIQRLISAPTGLQLTTPTNPFTGSINSWSIQTASTNPTERIDYIFPCALLQANITGSQVFRTDLLTPLPAGLNASDDATASDHLPVLMTFANPFAQSFRVTTFSLTNNAVNLQWAAVPGGLYRVESSTNLMDWSALVTNLLTTNYNGAFNTNAGAAAKFFRVRSP